MHTVPDAKALSAADLEFAPVADAQLSAERDFGHCPPVRMRYALISSPRTGSTLLSGMLFRTRVAGDPLEYLNSALLGRARFLGNTPGLTPEAFVRQMERRRTSANGLFGLKIHFGQFIAFADDPLRPGGVPPRGLQFIRGFEKYVWVRRRKRLEQAVSLAIATRSNRWSSEDRRPSISMAAADFSMRDLIDALHVACVDEMRWAGLIRRLGLQPLEVWYEDLTADYENQSRRVLAHLGVDASVAVVPDPPTERQSTPLNRVLVEQLKTYLSA